MNDSNAWDWWSRALETPKDIGQQHLPVSVDDPQQGFYKTKFKGQQWEPVAIWKQDGEWFALRSGKPVDPNDVWNWCCRYPITSEAYQMALDSGRWAGDDPTVVGMMGHNVGDDDEAAALADQIEAAKQGAELYRDIQDEEQAGAAQSLRARMNELAGQADKIRERLKRPHFEAAKAVDSEWMPLVKEAKGVADTLRKYIEAFKTFQLKEQRRLEEERRRAEQAQQAGEEAVVVPPPPPPITDATVKGNYGRAATVVTELVVVAITDQDALYQSLRAHPDLTACLLKLAQSLVRAGQTVPGIEVEERAKIS